MKIILSFLLIIHFNCLSKYIKPNTFSNTKITNNLLYDFYFYQMDGELISDREISTYERTMKSLREEESPEKRNLYAIYSARLSYWTEAEEVWKLLIQKDKNKFFF